MIEAPEFLPLGSVVSLKGNPKKLLLIGRALLVENEGTREYYDYSFCLYPEGMVGDAVIYSNHENVDSIHFRGFEDEENAQVLDNVRAAVLGLDVPKAQPQAMGAW